MQKYNLILNWQKKTWKFFKNFQLIKTINPIMPKQAHNNPIRHKRHQQGDPIHGPSPQKQPSAMIPSN